MVRLPALRTGRLYHPGRTPDTYFCQRLSQLQSHRTAGRSMSMKNSNNTIGNRTRDLPVWSAVPQPFPMQYTYIRRFHLFIGHEGPQGEQRYSSTLFLASALEEGEGSASRPGRTLLPGNTRYALYRRLGGTQGRSGLVRKTSPPTGIRSPDRPTRRQSLYRLRYTAHSRPLYMCSLSIYMPHSHYVHSLQVYSVSISFTILVKYTVERNGFVWIGNVNISHRKKNTQSKGLNIQFCDILNFRMTYIEAETCR